jgi:hypothetical protein
MANNEQPTIPKPDVTDEHRERAKSMVKSYDDDRPTSVLPGTGHTVAGQAVTDWIDDEGNPKHGEVAPDGGVKREDVMGVREKGMADE